jgi:uncharacterized protein (DUF58 family)
LTALLDASLLRKLDRLQLVTRQAMMGDLQGERRSVRRGASVEFADFRPYVAGDDFRQIDWNLYARLERFFLKLFVAEEELTVHILIDTSSSMDWGEPNKFHYVRQVAGAFGYIVLNNLDRVSVTVFSPPATSLSPDTGSPSSSMGSVSRLPGVRGKRGVFPLFDFLQKISPGGRGHLATNCRSFLHTLRSPGPVLLCSDLLDPTWEEGLRTLSARPFDTILLQVLAPQEITPQLEGDFRLIDSEGGAPVEITADLDLLRRYHENLASWRAEVSAFCRGRGIPYLFADTSTPIEEFVLTHMRKQGVVR